MSGLLFLLMKRKSGRGFAGRLARVWVLFVWCDLPSFLDLFGPCTKCCFTAYAHVRTEPQCDIGHTREKKMNPLFLHDSRFHKKTGDAKLQFYQESCRSWTESVHLRTNGKG